ncbi:MAG: GNAT family N-acetyltransferase [Pseudomonadota bacterium]
MAVTIHFATQSDRDLILTSQDLFDDAPRAEWVDVFLADPRHHMALAVEGSTCLGFLSALDYVHPDKPPQMWINELGVVETRRREGIATALIDATLKEARLRQCSELWVLADPTPEALGFYASLNAQREGSHIAMFTFDLTGPAR